MTTQKANTRHIDELHNEHKVWETAVEFYADELKIYEQRLAEVASKNTDIEVRKRIEHFQNQFILQKEQLDILKHDINKKKQWLTQYAIDHPVAIDHVLFADHKVLRDQYDTYSRIYTELRKEFMDFAGKWM